MIMKLEGHHSEVWALAVAKYGSFIVTGSHDRSIRVWRKTDEQLFLDEEREREMEAMYDQQEVDDRYENRPVGSGVEDELGNLPHVKEDEVGVPTRKTGESLVAGERIVEALDVWVFETTAIKEWQEV